MCPYRSKYTRYDHILIYYDFFLCFCSRSKFYRVETEVDRTIGIPPLMTVEVWAKAIGLDVTVVQAQVNRGYWPTIRVGKRRLVNVEAIRIKAAERAAELTL